MLKESSGERFLQVPYHPRERVRKSEDHEEFQKFQIYLKRSLKYLARSSLIMMKSTGYPLPWIVYYKNNIQSKAYADKSVFHR